MMLHRAYWMLHGNSMPRAFVNGLASRLFWRQLQHVLYVSLPTALTAHS
jgi:hypothetical protein